MWYKISMPHLLTWKNSSCPKRSHAPSLLLRERKRHPFFLSPKKKKEDEGHPTQPHVQSLSSPPLLKEFLRDFATNFYASKRYFSTDFTAKNWRRKVLPKERKIEKEEGSSFLCTALKKEFFFQIFLFFLK